EQVRVRQPLRPLRLPGRGRGERRGPLEGRGRAGDRRRRQRRRHPGRLPGPRGARGAGRAGARLRAADPGGGGGRALLPALDAPVNLDLLAVIVLVPAAGAVLLAFIPAAAERTHKVVALVLTTALFLLSLALVEGFRAEPGMQFEVSRDWLPALGIRYHVGI